MEVTGEGFPVVMIHGLGGIVEHVPAPDGGAARLSGDPHRPAGRRALAGAGHETALDRQLRGCGRACPAPLLASTRAHFVGHSMGTLVCQHDRGRAARPRRVADAVRRPDRAFGRDADRPARPGPLARTEGMAPIADQIIEGALSSETKTSRPAAVAFVRESVMRQDPEGYARHCEALASARAVDHRRIAAPALLVAGEADGTAPASVAREPGGTAEGCQGRGDRAQRPLADDREAARMQRNDARLSADLR